MLRYAGLLKRHGPRLMAWAMLCCALLLPHAAWAAPKQVVVVLSEDSALYQEAATALRENLEGEIAAGRLQLKTQVVGEAPAAQPGDALLVPLGAKAIQAAAQMEQPVLAGLVTQQSYEKYLMSGGRRHASSAVYLEQPLARYLQLLRAVQPKSKTVGALFGAMQVSEQQSLGNAAQASGLQLASARLNSGTELFASLQAMLPNIDVLLLLPDPLVVNRNSVQHLMLSAYRLRVPAIGYSESLVDAGALAAVYTTPRQIGKQLAESIQGMAPGKSWELPAPAYPKYFSIKTNASVARSLEIAIPGEATIKQRMAGGAGL